MTGLRPEALKSSWYHSVAQTGIKTTAGSSKVVNIDSAVNKISPLRWSVQYVVEEESWESNIALGQIKQCTPQTHMLFQESHSVHKTWWYFTLLTNFKQGNCMCFFFLNLVKNYFLYLQNRWSTVLLVLTINHHPLICFKICLYKFYFLSTTMLKNLMIFCLWNGGCFKTILSYKNTNTLLPYNEK